jgi:hypothetical protein
MSNDLISRKSVLDYIENEISKAKSTETISYLRALSVHINEFEPTAYDVDKVVKELEKESELIRPVGWAYPQEVIATRCVIDTIKRGGIDE